MGFLVSSGSLLGPYSSSRRLASSPVRPFSLAFRMSKASSQEICSQEAKWVGADQGQRWVERRGGWAAGSRHSAARQLHCRRPSLAPPIRMRGRTRCAPAPSQSMAANEQGSGLPGPTTKATRTSSAKTCLLEVNLRLRGVSIHPHLACACMPARLNANCAQQAQEARPGLACCGWRGVGAAFPAPNMSCGVTGWVA